MKPSTDAAAERRPRLALAIATGLGLGYLPIAPGTWGSLGGIVLALFPPVAGLVGFEAIFHYPSALKNVHMDPLLILHLPIAVVVALVGVWGSGRSAGHFGARDPSMVVIDEISGQHLTLLLGGFWPLTYSRANTGWIDHPLGVSLFVSPNWKYFLAGFILFRVFDIWKPFPARQSERLPGGWGIMMDDWIAAVYAALGLCLARRFGL